MCLIQQFLFSVLLALVRSRRTLLRTSIPPMRSSSSSHPIQRHRFIYPLIPCTSRAADKTARVALVVGSTDILASHSEHLFLADLAAKLGIYLPCFSIEGGGHILFHHDEGRSIVNAISAALAALKHGEDERGRGESRLAEFEERLRQTTWQLT